MVSPGAPRPGTDYFNSRTGETETVAAAENQIRQPNYTRGAANVVTSPRLRGLQGCVREAMSGQSFTGRKGVLKELNNVSKSCKQQLDTEGVPGGIPEQFRSTFEG
ncbi:MAG: hypothetical protein GWN41_13475 [Phycisphaerae bacterium]|nr:hypothetical protein [Phycisphaerae bacterium]